MGRGVHVTAEERQEIIALYKQGVSPYQITAQTGRARTSVYRVLQKAGLIEAHHYDTPRKKPDPMTFKPKPKPKKKAVPEKKLDPCEGFTSLKTNDTYYIKKGEKQGWYYLTASSIGCFGNGCKTYAEAQQRLAYLKKLFVENGVPCVDNLTLGGATEYGYTHSNL